MRLQELEDWKRERRRNLVAVKRQVGKSKPEERFTDKEALLDLMLATPNLYVVSYGRRGSRINGSYLVNAKSKSEANRIVKAVDPDYVGMRAQPLQQAMDEMGYDEYFVPEMGRIPEPGQAEFIEAGT